MPANGNNAENLGARVQSGARLDAAAPPRRVNYEKLAMWTAIAVGPWLFIALVVWLFIV